MSNPHESSFSFGKPSSDLRQKTTEPLRILFLTDLGETCRSRVNTPLASRPMQLVDIDIGFGVGLALAKRHIEAVKGSVFARNNQANGMVFTVLLPI